jgi:hypothetical protein
VRYFKARHFGRAFLFLKAAGAGFGMPAPVCKIRNLHA